MTATISSDTVAVGATAPTVAVGTPVPANAVIGATTWVSDTPATASITLAGVVTIVAAGTTKFTATETATGVTSSVDLTVTT